MSFNGSGTFVINSAGQPVVAGTTITATAFNALTADLATGLSTAILKDGTQTATAPIPFYVGSVSLPGIYLGTDTATGFYRIGSNNWGWAGNGAKVVDFNTTGISLNGTQNLGTWITPAFAAGDYTASGSQTWTLQSGDVTTMQYMLCGKTMFVNFFLVTTTVAGTPAPYLFIKIPGGKVSATPTYGNLWINQNGAFSIGVSIVNNPVAGANIALSLVDGANWTGTTNTTSVGGSIVFETT